MATREAPDATGTTKGIELVDEDDGRCFLPRVLEEIAHARCADADKHLDEL